MKSEYSRRRKVAAAVRGLILPRPRDSFKTLYGHTLVIAGSRGMIGAAVLCSHAAYRSGAGLVTVCVPAGQQAAITGRLRPEVMTLALPESRSGGLDERSAAPIMDFIDGRKVAALVIGPGLGCNPAVHRLVRKLLLSVALPVVLDADGVSVLAYETKQGSLKVPALSRAAAKVVLTPHPGEFSRITGLPVVSIQNDRAGTAARFAKANGVICILKGDRTVVTDGNTVSVNTTGNPGMATGGSGDVLAGMVAALMAQVKEPRPLNAAVAGVFLHGLAGDIAAAEKTEIGLIAGDITEAIPSAVKRIMRAGKRSRNHG